MIKSEELEYLVKEAIRFFKKGSKTNDECYEDVAWDYARGILKNTLDESKKQDLYSRLIKKLNKEYERLGIKFSEEEHKIKFSNNDDNTIYVSDENRRAILLFLMDYNRVRFITQKRNEREEYIRRFSEAIHTILLEKESISDRPYEDAFKYVKEDYIHENTGTNEYVAPAKILMLLDPDKFIAWDNQIVKRFSLSSNTCKHYQIFNDLIDNFINKKEKEINNIKQYAEKYMEEENYINQDYHKIKKLLDMIFWIAYNKIGIFESDRTDTLLESPLKFYCYTEKLVISILSVCMST